MKAENHAGVKKDFAGMLLCRSDRDDLFSPEPVKAKNHAGVKADFAGMLLCRNDRDKLASLLPPVL